MIRRRPGTMVLLITCLSNLSVTTASPASVLSQFSPARVRGNPVELTSCISSALSKTYGSRLGAITRQDATDIIIFQPRRGLLGIVYSGFVRRWTLTVTKASPQETTVEFQLGDVEDLPADEVQQVWSTVQSCSRPGGKRSNR